MAEDDKKDIEKKTSTKKSKKKEKDGSQYIELEPTIEESEDLSERAPLSISQRRHRGRTMRRYKNRMSIARKKAAKRKASPEKLKVRARKKARAFLKTRLSGGKKYGDLSPSEKVQLDKRLHRIPDSTIKRIATRQLPNVRKAEIERLARARGGSSVKKESLDEQFELFLSEMSECPPKRHHTAMTKEGSVKFDKRFKIFKNKEQEKNVNEAYVLMQLVEGVVKKRFEDDSENREEGTDTLIQILKKNTPGEKSVSEGYFDTDLESTYKPISRGERVKFTVHSMDEIGDDEIEGTVVNSTSGYLRVRDDDGTLYKVRHIDAESLAEETIFFTLDESFELRFLDEASVMDRAIEAVHRHVSKGKDLEKTVWELVKNTGIGIGTKAILNQYIKTYGDPHKKSNSNPEVRKKIIGKYA